MLVYITTYLSHTVLVIFPGTRRPINRVQPVGTVTNERTNSLYEEYVLYCHQYRDKVLLAVAHCSVSLQCSVSMVIAVSMNTHRCIKNTAVRIF